MDRSTPIYLIGETYEPDEYGAMQPTKTRRIAYANVREVSQAEFFEGGRNGLNPALRFVIFGPEYGGEDTVEYNGVNYAIYRTYRARTDEMELYTELRKGKEPKAPQAGD